MIRQSDPELFQLAFNLRGKTMITQERKCALSQPSDLVLYHTSRPHQIRTGRVRADLGEHATQGVMVVFPAKLLPLSPRKVERLTATSLPGREGVGALLTGFLTQLTASTHQYGTAESVRLGTILVDLITTVLAHHLDADTAVPPPTHQSLLLMRVYAFIEQHLTDPGLSPATIAAAHSVSTRTLHRLFQTQNATVAGWIHARRLECCRHDLSDPFLADRPIHAIAAQWGFPAAAHFTRAFTAAYGLAPRDYRHRHRPDRHTRSDAGEIPGAGIRTNL
ncbi:hypothetical protein GCM10022252_73030 [Streptosporangium oxazolinicum]|uniref:HTH araC/xylS-type domain-containing protein n=2 Tax=Streptosporangium oxazolinicum TaxID=909287 RepID=A0ABP8BJ63_9ACTN